MVSIALPKSKWNEVCNVVVLMTDSNEALANTCYVVLQLLGFIGFRQWFRVCPEQGKDCFEHGKRNSNQQQKYHFLH